MTQLTKNFSLSEMTVTDCGLENTPNEDQKHYLKLLCDKVLQPLSDKYGKPIRVNSGFRSYAVNLHANKGVDRPSQHMKGQAVDIDNGYEENKVLFDILSKMDFDQLINEDNFGWVHVSFNPNANRKQKLKKVGKKYIPIP